MEIIVADDYRDMCEAAADIVYDVIASAPGACMGCGSEEDLYGVYASLTEMCAGGDLDFSRVAAFGLDEFEGLGPDSPDTKAAFLADSFFRETNLRPDNTYLFNGSNMDESLVCDAMETSIMLNGNFDVVLMTVGASGRLAMNEPAGEFSKECCRCVLDPATRKEYASAFDGEEFVPEAAYTAGIGTLMQAKKVVLAVSGAEKAQVVRDAFFGPITPACPASILQFHPNAVAVVDPEAFSLCEGVAQSQSCCGDHDHDHEHGCGCGH